MKKIQISIDEKTLAEIDSVCDSFRMNRSSFIRFMFFVWKNLNVEDELKIFINNIKS